MTGFPPGFTPPVNPAAPDPDPTPREIMKIILQRFLNARPNTPVWKLYRDAIQRVIDGEVAGPKIREVWDALEVELPVLQPIGD